MREIKFRAWDNKSKKWLLGYEYENLGGFSLFGECVLMGEWQAVLNEFLFNRNDHKLEDLVVMQYTGLKDKDGKEIYEGDIVECKDMHDGNIDFWIRNPPRFKIEWQGDNACFAPDNCSALPMDIETHWEAVGNIYENPELIAP